MALTHSQRTSMFRTLAEVMGQPDAETLMDHLPPSGWDNVATKDDLRAGLAEINATLAAGLAQAAVERAETKETVTAGLAQAAVERAQIKETVTAGLAQAAVERAEIRAEAALERAEIIRRQVWHLYIMVSTFVLASVSIWIALLMQNGGSGG